MSMLPGKPYSFEFLVENREKIWGMCTNEQIAIALTDIAERFEEKGLVLNSASVREAARRIRAFERQFNSTADDGGAFA